MIYHIIKLKNGFLRLPTSAPESITKFLNTSEKELEDLKKKVDQIVKR